MGKGKGKEEDGGWAPAVWESGWCNISIIVMSLLQYISRCDRAQPSGAIACWRASIIADDLISSHLIFRGWGSFRRIRASLYIECMRKEDRRLFSRVCWRISSHLRAWTSSSEYQSGEMLFSPFGCFVAVCLVGHHFLALEGLLRDRHGEQCWFGCIEAVWAAVETYSCLLRSHGGWLLLRDLLRRANLCCSCIGGLVTLAD